MRGNAAVQGTRGTRGALLRRVVGESLSGEAASGQTPGGSEKVCGHVGERNPGSGKGRCEGPEPLGAALRVAQTNPQTSQ